MEQFIPYIIVLALVPFVCVFLKRTLSDKKMRRLKLRNLYGDFVYFTSRKAFTAKIYWCDHYIIADLCCTDPQSSSCRLIQDHFQNIMVYSPSWDQTLKRKITNFFFTENSEFVEFEAPHPFGKNIYLRSKAAFQDSLVLVQLLVYPSGALTFVFRNKDIPELNCIFVDTCIQGLIYCVLVRNGSQDDFHVVWNTTRAIPRLPYPDGDRNNPSCPWCRSGKFLHNADGTQVSYCGQCGQAIKWESDTSHS